MRFYSGLYQASDFVKISPALKVQRSLSLYEVVIMPFWGACTKMQSPTCFRILKPKKSPESLKQPHTLSPKP